MKELQAGDLFDNFRITKQLHLSAVASIYKARDLLYDCNVVLKIPLDDIINHPVLLYHHQNESRISRHLNHPCINRYLERYKNHQYLVMEFIEGRDLRNLLTRKGKIPLGLAISYFCQIAEGLSYLHEKNILHLDLKPENIMITPDNKVKIIDFGLSHHLGYGDVLGLDFKGPKGTPYYIAPEQLCGIRNSKQSDIYGLGILFYEMLTGNLPFERSSSLAKVQERLRKDPVPPRYYERDIPPSLQDIILRCLKRNPDNRPLSIAKLVAEVKNYRALPPGNYGNLITKPLSLLSYFDFSTAQYFNPAENLKAAKIHSPRRKLLGCIADHESSEAVIDYIRRDGILHGGSLTLLHVIEESDTNEYEKYAHEVEGSTLWGRLDSYLSELNRYNLYPELRIMRGKAADQIVEMAQELQADLIVIGRPRTRSFLSKVFTGSVMEKIVQSELTNVVVAQSIQTTKSLLVENLHSLTQHDLNDLEIFFNECWVEQLKALTRLTHNLLDPEDHIVDLTRFPHQLQHWLEKIAEQNEFYDIFKFIYDSNTNFHAEVQMMVKQGRDGEAMKKRFREKVVPMLMELKKQQQNALFHLKTLVFQ